MKKKILVVVANYYNDISADLTIQSKDILSKNKLKNDGNPELFTGEFWSGSTAKKLGLIDDIGNADDVIKEKYGEDVEIKKLEKQKSIFFTKKSKKIVERWPSG